MHAIPVPRIQLDPGRIASISGAIAVNGLLLLLLVAPMSPVVRVAQDRDIVVEPIFVRRDPPPPPPPPPQPVPVTPTPVPVTHATPAREVAPPQPEAVLEDSQRGDTQATTTAEPVRDAVLPPADIGKPLAGAHLEYAVAPPPPYPREALVDGDAGTVLLEVLVDVDGRPLEVRVAKSSGSRALDVAARRQVLAKWRFRPAMRDGVAVQAIGMVPVEFTLD